jgi:hypothetical protein
MEHFLRQNKALIALDAHFARELAPPLLCQEHRSEIKNKVGGQNRQAVSR